MHRLSAQVWLRTVLPDCSRGLRAALATVVPFYFSIALNRPELAWIAIGGWLGSLVDSGGSRGRRAVLIGTFALGGGLVVALTTLARTWPLGGVVLLAGLAWLTSLVRALGGSAAGWGTTLLVAACIASGVDSAGPVRDGLLFALGASWAVVLSSVVWPVWTHLPLRRALADVLDELAEYCSRVRQAGVAALPPHHAGWTLVARESQRRVRAAIENARLVALLLRSRRSGETGVGSGLRILLGDTETEFAKLISAAERFELSPSERDKMLPGLARLESRLREAKELLLSSHYFDRETHLSLSTGSTAASPPTPTQHPWEELPPQAQHPPEEPPPLSLQLWAEKFRILRDSLSFQSPFFRHALRVSVAVSAAALVARWISPSHAAWITVTTVGVLQPYPGATMQRASQRVVGTVLGSIVAVALMNFVRDPLWLSIALIPLSAAAVITRPRSYRWFTFFLTPVFILFSGSGLDWWVAFERTLNAAIGGFLALLASACFFPSWEKDRLPEAMARVLDALEHYARATLLAADRTPAAEGHASHRRAVGVALGEAENSLERMLAEPRLGDGFGEYAMQLLTYSRRLSNALTAVNHDVSSVDRSADTDANGWLVDLIGRSLDAARTQLQALGSFIVTRPPTNRDVDVSIELPVLLGRIARYAQLIGQLKPSPATFSV